MGFYLGNFFLIYLFLIYDLKKKKNSYKVYWVLVVYFFILSFIRTETGTDWLNYYNNFNNLNYGNEYFKYYEKGYSFLVVICKKIFYNYNFYLFINALIIYTLIYKTLRRESKIIIYSLLVTYCTSLSYILFVPRQTIAIAVVIYSLKYIEEKKKIKFILTIIIASFFHYSSLIFFIAYVVYHKTMSKKQYIYMIIFTLTAGYAFKLLLPFTLSLLKIHPVIYSKVSNYIFNQYIDGKTRNFIKVLLTLFLSKGFIILLILKYKNKLSEKEQGWCNLYIGYIIIFILSIYTSPVFLRFSYYFEFFECLILPSIVYSQNKFYNKISLFFIINLFLLIRLFLRLIGGYSAEYIPYKTILFL